MAYRQSWDLSDVASLVGEELPTDVTAHLVRKAVSVIRLAVQAVMAVSVPDSCFEATAIEFMTRAHAAEKAIQETVERMNKKLAGAHSALATCERKLLRALSAEHEYCEEVRKKSDLILTLEARAALDATFRAAQGADRMLRLSKQREAEPVLPFPRYFDVDEEDVAVASVEEEETVIPTLVWTIPATLAEYRRSYYQLNKEKICARRKAARAAKRAAVAPLAPRKRAPPVRFQ